MTPAEARFVLTSVGLPSLRMEHAITRRVLEAVPAEREDHRPAAGARTLSDLARHIASSELRFLQGVLEGSFPEPGAPADAAALSRWYAESIPPIFERLAEVPGERLLREIDYRGLIRMPALGFVNFALHHTIHHRGQLSVYLRTVGASVPPIYG